MHVNELEPRATLQFELVGVRSNANGMAPVEEAKLTLSDRVAGEMYRGLCRDSAGAKGTTMRSVMAVALAGLVRAVGANA